MSLEPDVDDNELALDPGATMREAYIAIFCTPGGVMVLRDLLEVSGFLSIFPTGAEPQVLAHQNGTRAVFAHVYAILMSTARGRETIAEAFRPASTKE